MNINRIFGVFQSPREGKIMKDKSIIVKLIDMLFYFLIVYLISYFNNLFTTILITFFLINIMFIVDELLEIKLFHKKSKLVKAISEIKKIDNKTEKIVNIITLLYPSIFATILAFVLHLLYRFIR